MFSIRNHKLRQNSSLPRSRHSHKQNPRGRTTWGAPPLTGNNKRGVDDMFRKGMVEELRPFYSPDGDYSRGIRRAIGVPEFDEYFRREEFVDEETKQRLSEDAIREIKLNTWKLAMKQLGKIHRLRNVKRWEIHRLDATPVFRRRGEEANEAWKKLVAEPTAMVVARFLYNSKNNANVVSGLTLLPPSENVMAAATC